MYAALPSKLTFLLNDEVFTITFELTTLIAVFKKLKMQLLTIVLLKIYKIPDILFNKDASFP